ncbi:MAG: cellulase family glycosylhydrolase [Planctomycetes bacterium]|nr:cellulase family glycosylhydrolase [Planctomycetota bacterium]
MLPRLFWLLSVSLLPGQDTAPEPGGFARVERGGFACGGKPFTAAGMNCYYLMVYAASPGLRGAVDEVLGDARQLGATVLRTWAFNDGAGQWNALQTSPGVYDEKVFIGLDYVVKRAGELGLRLVLPLVNNWSDYGGMDQYVEWSPDAASHDDFYTDPSCRQWYRDHAARVLHRINTFTGLAYKDDPAIFAWELANEPRARAKGAAVLNAWIAEMAAYLKTLDPNHLVSTGSEGFYGPSGPAHNPAAWMAKEGVDFIGGHSSPAIDFASFHAYPDLWGLSEEPAVQWVRDHLADARNLLGKPVLLGEFGKKQPVSLRDRTFAAFYDELIAASEPGIASAGPLFWILYHDSYPDYDGFGVYYPSPAHASTAALVLEKQEALRSIQEGARRFIRGNANCDEAIDLADAIAILQYLFARGPASCCLESADVNGDGEIDLADPVYGLIFLYRGARPPPPPFPGCGAAPGGSGAGLGCENFPICN